MATATPFVPQGKFSHLSEYFDKVPTFLFRTWAPNTNGLNTMNGFYSAAKVNQFDVRDLFSRSEHEAATMLELHCRWKSKPTDNLISWTNSFLFAVQLALHRLERDRPTPKESDIYITVLNTKHLPRGCFLPSMPLLDAYQVPETDDFPRKWFPAEFIAQEHVVLPLSSSAHVATTTLAHLIKHGLYKLYPAFADQTQRYKLASRVLELRNTYLQHETPPTAAEFLYAKSIANGCFSAGVNKYVMALTLLTLAPRPRLDSTMSEILKGNATIVRSIRESYIDSYLTTSEKVPEHRQFVELMHIAHAIAKRSTWEHEGNALQYDVDVDPLVQGLGGLSLVG